VRISLCVGQGLSNALYIDLLRPESQWQYFGQDAFHQAVEQYKLSNRNDELPIIMGLDEMGQVQYQDLATCNHILVAGKTGAGKSVFIRTLLGSLFALNDDKTVNVAILDPKQGVDYANYKELPHLWDNRFITNITDISDALVEISEEMEHRDEERALYNATKLADIPKTNRPPYLIVVIDEVADLLDTDPEIETSIMRLTQRGRASGIFVILATQSPDSKTLTTRLRANLATRIALSVATARASSTILDETGAENLIGKGDHLVKWLGKEAQFLHGYDV
jgi:S-DNA-T family DNA segregation ATPase FtsK/SpoIIIE